MEAKTTKVVTDKPGAERAGWRPIGCRVPYADERLGVREDEVAPLAPWPCSWPSRAWLCLAC